MRKARFKGPLLEGHKEDAVEVPFSPEVRWSVPARALWPGRRGHAVQGTLNGKSFDSFIVGRSRRYYVLVSGDIRKAAKIAIGDIVDLALQPKEDNESKTRRDRRLAPSRR